MAKLREKIKLLRKKSKAEKQRLSTLLFLVIIPLIVFFWLVSLRSSLERVSLGKEVEPFGEKLIKLMKQIGAIVNQGATLLFSRLTQIDWRKIFTSLGQLLLGKPRVEFLEPGQPVELPISS